jgi:hypothetical protein
MLKDQLELLNKEFTVLKQKITTKLAQKEQALTKSQQEKQEAITNLESSLKENSANEQVLERLIKEMQELAKTL